MPAQSSSRRRDHRLNGRTEFYHRALGKQFIDYETEPIFHMGEVVITRQELATRYGCCHLAAARRISRALKEAGITSINRLHATPPDELATLPGVGAVQMFVVMCVLDQNKFDAAKWYGLTDDTVTVHTLQARAERREAEMRQRRRQSANA